MALSSLRGGFARPGLQAPHANRKLVQSRSGLRVVCSAAAQKSHYDVHKFGGTCVATADRIQRAAEFVSSQADPVCVVVSALGTSAQFPLKVTDVLLRLIAAAEKGSDSYTEDLKYVYNTHVEVATQLLGKGAALDAFVKDLGADVENLTAMLRAIQIARGSTEVLSDFIIGHGEIWSAKLFTATCKKFTPDAAFLDARDVLVVSFGDGIADVDEERSKANMQAWLDSHKHPRLVVATGFVARTPQGAATTLKRNGSDFSATIFGSLLSSKLITIWTDVDGVFSADPRKVPEALCLSSMSYNEARELAYFGANVLHPHTTVPAMKDGIPIAIRNFFNMDCAGTCISNQGDPNATVKGLATIDNVALISVEGTGMAGVPGIASTVFGVVKDLGINIIMISQASSEQSICFAVAAKDGQAAAQALQRRFSDALTSGRLSRITCTPNCCVLAVIGEGMVNRKGVAATFFGAMAKANVNIKAIAQGSSEYNITVLIDQRDGERALRAAHSRFYLSDVPLGVALVGPGQIGKTLLAQFAAQSDMLKHRLSTDIRVLAIADSKRMVLSTTGIDLSNWESQFASQAKPLNMEEFERHLQSSYIPNIAVIDCTASDAPAERYDQWMSKGFHVVTPNKKLGSGPLARYNTVRKLQREGLIHFFYEATVGAGLPIMGTLKHLIETGDNVVKIEGIFSGTLSYIFNTWNESTAFSDVVKEAKAKGFTEPDAREDLSGMDVARKVTILARECGVSLELSDVQVESLVPEALQQPGVTGDQFISELHKYDDVMVAKLAKAQAAGNVLRYVGVVDMETGKAAVGLREYPKDHPFAQLQGTDNIISFTTQRYFKQPLVVRGPGAGAEVTAAGVFSDILRLSAYLGAPS